MAKRPRDSVEREIMDIIPERFDDSENPGERRGGHTRLMLTIALGLLALAAVGVAARHLLVGDGPRSVADANVPIVKPDDKPIKTKPEDRGGMAVPNQDKLVYQDLGKTESSTESGAIPEKLLPPPEKPQAPAKSAPADSASSAMPPPPAAAGSDIPAPPPVAATSGGSIAAPDKSSAPPAPTAAPAPAVQSSALSPVKETGKKSPEAAKKDAAAPAAEALKPTTTAAATPAPAPAPKVAPAAGGSGNFQVQLAAMKSEAEAEAVWKKVQGANKDLLGTMSPDIVRADLGAKGVFFRLRAGALDEAAAKNLCAELTKRNQVCIVAKK